MIKREVPIEDRILSTDKVHFFSFMKSTLHGLLYSITEALFKENNLFTAIDNIQDINKIEYKKLFSIEIGIERNKWDFKLVGKVIKNNDPHSLP